MWGGLLSGVAGLFTGKEKARREARATREANAALVQGRDMAFNESGLGGFRDRGNAAADAQMGLLNIGGDPAASRAGFDNYLDSAGYRFQLDEGQNAVNASTAARGLRNSGAAVKESMRFGQGLSGNFFQQYMDRLQGVSGQGLQAAGGLANAATGTANQIAGTTQRGGMQAADSRDRAYGNFFTGVGDFMGNRE